MLGSQSRHHLREDAVLTPPLPAVVERLSPTVFPGYISPPQPTAIDEDNLTQNTPVIHTRLAMATRKEGPKPLHLLVGQPNNLLITTPE